MQAIHQTLASSGIDVSRFNGHSSKIGAANAVAAAGLSDSRWDAGSHRLSRTTLDHQLQEMQLAPKDYLRSVRNVV